MGCRDSEAKGTRRLQCAETCSRDYAKVCRSLSQWRGVKTCELSVCKLIAQTCRRLGEGWESACSGKSLVFLEMPTETTFTALEGFGYLRTQFSHMALLEWSFARVKMTVDLRLLETPAQLKTPIMAWMTKGLRSSQRLNHSNARL